MTENEAIQQLEFDRAMALFDPATGEVIKPEILKALKKENYLTYMADEVAIKALKEIQQYRAIGTVEECRKAVEKQKNWRICFNYGDEREEEKACRNMQREYPRQGNEVEKTKIW